MKRSLPFLALIGSCVYAGRQHLSISVRDGSIADGIGSVDPTLKWNGSFEKKDVVNLSYGIESSMRPTKDIVSLPKSIWGLAVTKVGGWGISAGAELESLEHRSVNLEVEADNANVDLNLRISLSSSGTTTPTTVSMGTIEATKGIEIKKGGSRMTFNPRYNVDAKKADAVIGYNNKDQTMVELTASKESQSVRIQHPIVVNTNLQLSASTNDNEAMTVTITQKFDDRNTISPTVSSNGDLALEWNHYLGDTNTFLTTTLKPNDSLGLQWKDVDWTANVDIPLDGRKLSESKLNIQRDVFF